MAQQSYERITYNGQRATSSTSRYGSQISSGVNVETRRLSLQEKFVAAVQPSNPLFPNKLLPRPYSWSKELRTAGFGHDYAWDYTQANGYVYTWYRTSKTGALVTSLPYGTMPNLDRIAIYNNALEKFYGKIRGSDNVNLAVDLAELPSTVRMVHSYGRDILKLRKHLLKELWKPAAITARRYRIWKKTNKRSLQRVFASNRERLSLSNFDEFAASQWLKFTLGLKPTVSTLTAMAKLSPKIADVTHAVTGTSQGMVRGREKSVNGDQTTIMLHDILCNVRVTGYYSVDDAQAAKLHSIAPDSALPTAWELIPLSFVADYFANVGQYLNLMDAAHARGLTFRGGYVRYYDQKVTSTEQASSTGDSTKGRAFFIKADRSYKSYSRVLIGSFPRPGRPSVRLNLNGDKIANIGALLDQYFRRLVH